MKKYYYSDGVEKYGPFSLEELKTYDIENDTLIWYEGMDDWKRAGDMPNISMLFDLSTPPPARIERNNPIDFLDDEYDEERPKPKSFLLEAILVTLLCIPFGIVAIVYAAQVESKYNAYGYKEAAKASENALLWTRIALGVGIVSILIRAFVIMGI